MRLERKINQESDLKRTAVCRYMCLSGQWTLQTFCKILPTLTVTVR
jgi:hypothetical protein